MVQDIFDKIWEKTIELSHRSQEENVDVRIIPFSAKSIEDVCARELACMSQDLMDAEAEIKRLKEELSKKELPRADVSRELLKLSSELYDEKTSGNNECFIVKTKDEFKDVAANLISNAWIQRDDSKRKRSFERRSTPPKKIKTIILGDD